MLKILPTKPDSTKAHPIFRVLNSDNICLTIKVALSI